MGADEHGETGSTAVATLERWARHPAGWALLFASTVAEATLFPAPTEALLIAMALARPERVPALVAVAALGAGVGAALGYAAGGALYGPVLEPLLQWQDALPHLERVRALYADNLPLALLTSGYTPIPFLVYTLAAGAFGVPLAPYLIFALLGRGIKYAVLGTLSYFLGPPVRWLLTRYAGRTMLAVGFLLLVAWLLSRL